MCGFIVAIKCSTCYILFECVLYGDVGVLMSIVEIFRVMGSKAFNRIYKNKLVM